MDGERSLGETPRVRTPNPPLVESEALRVFVHQRMVFGDVHQGIVQDLVSRHQVHAHGVG